MLNRIIGITIALSGVILGRAGAQELPIYDNNANRVDIYHFQKYLDNQVADENQQSIGSLPTAVLRFPGDTLSTRELNRANYDPELVEERTLVLTLPTMPLALDTLILMVVVPSSNDSRELVNVILIENRGDHLAYHFDRDNDYSFLDEEEPYIFTRNQPVMPLRIETGSTSEVTTYYVYDLAQMPSFLARYGIRLEEHSYVNNYYYPMLNRYGRFSLQLLANFGKGHHVVSYQTPAVGRELTASLNAITQWGASLQYALYNVNLGLFVRMEGNQIGSTERHTYENGERSIDYGFGNWPRRRVFYGLEIGYDLRVYKNIYVSPMYRLGTYRFTQNAAFTSKIGSSLSHTLRYNEIFRKPVLQNLGVQVKLPVGEKSLLLIEGSWIKNRYTLHPDFIQEEVIGGSLSSDYQEFVIGVGVQWLLMTGP